MRYFLLTILLILSSLSTCLAQNDPVKVPFVAYWAVGDTFDFTISKIKSSWKEGTLDKTDTTQFVARFEVLDSTDSFYRIKWSKLETLIQTRNLPGDISKALTDVDLQNIIYRTDELGSFEELEDWEEISENMKIILEKVEENLKRESDPTLDVEKLIRPLMQVYTSKQGLQQNVFKELQYLHFPFGAQFTEGDTLNFEENLPNMLGGNPIPGRVKVYIEKVDVENAYCMFKREMNLDSEAVVRVLKQAFKQMGLDSDEMKKAMKNARYEIKDSHAYEYIYDPGIPIRIEIKRESDVEIAGVKGYTEDILLIEWFGE